MTQQSPLESEVAQIIVETLQLQDVSAGQIDPNAPLFVEGLGLDSIDALELALAISNRYGVQVRSDDKEDAKRTFASLRSLSAYIDHARHQA